MAISERRPRPQQPEHTPVPDTAAIASHVAYVVGNLQRDSQEIQNPFELCRRADMAMVAMLEVVSPVLPEIVKEQVYQLMFLHDALYEAALPSPEQPDQEHEH